MQMIFIFLILIPITLGGCGNGPEQTEPERINILVEQVVDTYGGREALVRIDGYVAVGKLFAIRRNLLIRTTRWFQRPDRLLLELAYPGQPEWRLTRGRQSWQGAGPSRLKPATGPVIWSMRLQTARLDLPIRLHEHRGELVMAPPDDSGRTVLTHDLGDGLRMAYHVDGDSFLITQMTMSMSGPPTMDFAAEYGDFRPVAGVMLPHREVTRAGGTVTSNVVIDTFLVNPPNLDARLQAPGSDI